MRRDILQSWKHASSMTLFYVIFYLIIVSEADDVKTLRPDVGPYPPFWDKAPETLADFETVKGVTMVDPWNYLHRLAMYRLLLVHTEAAMKHFAPDNTGNMLWGLPLQHGWQFETKRLNNPARLSKNGVSDDGPGSEFCISGHSWWGSMNYNFNVVVFMGAVKAGLFDYWKKPIHMYRPACEASNVTTQCHSFSCASPSKFCTTVTECMSLMPKATEGWANFFTLVLDTLNQTSMNYPEAEDKLLKAMWTGHEHAIDESLPLYQPLLRYVSVPEQRFGLGWAKAVQCLAAARFMPNLNNTIKNQRLLPLRVLIATDNPPYIPDMSRGANKLLNYLNEFQYWDKFTHGTVSRLWSRAMCNKDGRRIGRKLIDDVMMKWRPVMDVLKLLWVMGLENRPCHTIYGHHKQ